MEARPDLTDDEIERICAPLTQPAAQIRYLRGLGLVVRRKPSGRPLVSRREFDRVMGGSAAEAEESVPTAPNVVALRERWANKRRSQHGAQARRG